MMYRKLHSFLGYFRCIVRTLNSGSGNDGRDYYISNVKLTLSDMALAGYTPALALAGSELGISNSL